MVYNKKQMAELLNISVETINRLQREGKIPHHRIRDRVIFTPADLDTFLQSCAIPAKVMPTSREQANMAKAVMEAEAV
jgi:excisionase family DNA binding protein